MPVRNCQTGCESTALREFVRGDGINGPDNIAFDENGILWVASGQNDRVVAVNPRGVVVAKIGSFEGFTRGGAPIGLLQPSGIVVVGERVYVGNEASRGLRPAPDLLPEETWDELRLFTIAEIRTWAVLFQQRVGDDRPEIGLPTGVPGEAGKPAAEIRSRLLRAAAARPR
jgi:hypothetical protein